MVALAEGGAVDGEEAGGGQVEEALPVSAGEAEGAGVGEEALPLGPRVWASPATWLRRSKSRASGASLAASTGSLPASLSARGINPFPVGPE
jgi:hypothetical protein